MEFTNRQPLFSLHEQASNQIEHEAKIATRLLVFGKMTLVNMALHTHTEFSCTIRSALKKMHRIRATATGLVRFTTFLSVYPMAALVQNKNVKRIVKKT